MKENTVCAFNTCVLFVKDKMEITLVSVLIG